MPVCTYCKNSSPRESTTGILLSVQTSPRMAPEAARESMGREKSIQAGCLPWEHTVKSTMPPVVEPMVWGRQRATPTVDLPYRSGLF